MEIQATATQDPTRDPAHQAGHDVKKMCQAYMNYHVIAHMNDGSHIDGILVAMNDNGVTILVAENIDGTEREQSAYRPIGFGPRFRRFRPRLFPFSLFAFPFFRPYPYIYPYPYNQGYGYGGGFF